MCISGIAGEPKVSRSTLEVDRSGLESRKESVSPRMGRRQCCREMESSVRVGW